MVYITKILRILDNGFAIFIINHSLIFKFRLGNIYSRMDKKKGKLKEKKKMDRQLLKL